MATLYIVATPIGNLEDITLRALEILKSVDCILCEDTRVTKKLLQYYEISTDTKSYHHHSGVQKMQEIQDLLESGKNLALVSDAGTPGVSDPGNILIQFLLQKMPDLKILPIPGPSALTSALSVCGFPTDKSLFLGFPPHKNKRLQFFEQVANSPSTVVFFESGHRIHKAIENLAAVLAPSRRVVIGREISKKFESWYRGSIEEVRAMNISNKGEFVILVNTQ